MKTVLMIGNICLETFNVMLSFNFINDYSVPDIYGKIIYCWGILFRQCWLCQSESTLKKASNIYCHTKLHQKLNLLSIWIVYFMTLDQLFFNLSDYFILMSLQVQGIKTIYIFFQQLFLPKTLKSTKALTTRSFISWTYTCHCLSERKLLLTGENVVYTAGCRIRFWWNYCTCYQQQHDESMLSIFVSYVFMCLLLFSHFMIYS